MLIKNEDVNWVLFDAMNLAYRAWYSVRHLTNTDGIPSGLEFGMLRSILKFNREYPNARLIMVWDGAPIYGLNIYEGYKKDRPAAESTGQDDWHPRITNLREILGNIVGSVYHPLWEADHCCGYIAKRLSGVKLLNSNDDDWMSWISDSDRIFTQKPDGTIFDEAMAREKWGVPVKYLPLFRAFDGDTSDKLPGVPRIKSSVIAGLVTGTNLELSPEAQVHAVITKAEQHWGLNEKNSEKFKTHRIQAEKNLKILDLKTAPLDKDLQPVTLQPPKGNYQAVIDMCKSLELQSLVEKSEWQQMAEKSFV